MQGRRDESGNNTDSKGSVLRAPTLTDESMAIATIPQYHPSPCGGGGSAEPSFPSLPVCLLDSFQISPIHTSRQIQVFQPLIPSPVSHLSVLRTKRSPPQISACTCRILRPIHSSYSGYDRYVGLCGPRYRQGKGREGQKTLQRNALSRVLEIRFSKCCSGQGPHETTCRTYFHNSHDKRERSWEPSSSCSGSRSRKSKERRLWLPASTDAREGGIMGAGQ